MKLLILLHIVLLALAMQMEVQGEGECDAGCDSCDNPEPQCQSCAESFILGKDKTTCDACPRSCKECQRLTDNTLKCTACSAGYLLEGECRPCSIVNCILCSVKNSVERCDLCSDPGYKGDECTGCPDGQYMKGMVCNICPPRCKKCNLNGAGEAMCTDCTVGNYVEDNGACASCDANCKMCQSEAGVLKCTKCYREYGIQPVICSACPTGCSVCISSSSGTCTACLDGYYLKNGECIDCPVRCSGRCGATGTCTGSTDCSGVGGVENCATCNINVDNSVVCQSCASASAINQDENGVTVCRSCQTGTGGVANCASCSVADGSVTCDGCVDGFYGTTSCTDCPVRCSGSCVAATGTCTGTGTDCSGDGGVENCATCNINADNTVDCVSCVSAYIKNDVPNGDPVCLSCQTGTSGVAGCAFCSAASGSVTCSGCVPGFYYGTTCTACSDFDGHCEECAADNTCTKCSEDFILKADATGCCDAGSSSSLADCAVCNTDESCAECELGFSFDTDNKCASCSTDSDSTGVANCGACTITGTIALGNNVVATCSECVDGYGVLTIGSEQQCVSCTGADPKCMECTASAADNVECSKCENDNNPIGNKCEGRGCLSNCEECVDETSCTQCALGYAKVYDTSDQVTGCSTCSANCQSCSSTAGNAQKCVVCEDEYVLDSDVCKACPNNCLTCPDTSSCAICLPNFGKDANGECVDKKNCNPHCESCVPAGDTYDCTTCTEGYYMKEPLCMQCTANCENCRYNDGIMECTLCNNGYLLINNFCTPCPNGCMECSTSSNCNQGKCVIGKAVADDGTCVDCPTLTEVPNCDQCEEKSATNPATCLRCIAGYTLKDEIKDRDAECISVSDLKCGTKGDVADKAFRCTDTTTEDEMDDDLQRNTANDEMDDDLQRNTATTFCVDILLLLAATLLANN